MTPAATVFGVPLEPGERVVYFHRYEPRAVRVQLAIMGLLSLVALIGFFFLYLALTASSEVYVVTTRRFLIIEGKKISSMRREDVKHVAREIKGGSLAWIKLSDGVNTLAWQVSANPPQMPQVLTGFLENPSSVEHAPTVPHESLT